MRLIRYTTGDSEVQWGVLVGEEVAEVIGDVLSKWSIGDIQAKLMDVTLHAPCVPSKVVCVAINYAGIEGFSSNMEEPLVFIKPGSSVVGPYSTVINPFPNSRWWGEAELGIVIKKRAHKITESQASEHVLGLTIGNDVTVENCDGRDHHLARSKGADGFCPLGPWIETEIPSQSLRIRAIQDGQCIREGWSHNQFWNWEKVLSRISQWMTLNPYDVVLTGNVPDTVGMRYLGSGAAFEAEIAGIGSLTNTFISPQ
jgi:2-keto-4-pentenoate hydratase/2-oxohepta-3-ene-1,7-dioic acid hydratase in catechol pathway